jgi:hypothetical protein
MGERFGVVGRPSQGLDPLRGGLMLGHTFGARNLSVRHFAHEQVPERVFRLVADRQPCRALNEALPLEDVQLLFGYRPRPPVDDAPEPEGLAEDGSILEKSLLLGRKEVQPGRDDALHGFRHGEIGRVLAFACMSAYCSA